MSYTLDELCHIEKGKIGITKAVDGEYPLVTTGEDFGTHNEYHFEGPAVCVPLVSSTGHGHASIKRLHYVEGKFACGNILAVLIPKDPSKLSAKFLYTYLTVHKQEKLVRKMKGAANVSLTMTNLSSVVLDNLPTLQEQEALSSLFFSAVEKINTLNLSNQKYLDLVKILERQIFSYATKGMIFADYKNRDEIDNNKLIESGWRFIELEKLVINRDSERVPLSTDNRKTHKNKQYPYYGASGIIDYVDDYIFDEKLLLLSEDGANLELRSNPVAFFADGKYWVNNHAHVLGADEMNKLEYLRIFIESISLKPYLSGSAQPKLSQKNLNRIVVPVPPDKLMVEIIQKVKVFERMKSSVIELIEKNEKLISKCKNSFFYKYV